MSDFSFDERYGCTNCNYTEVATDSARAEDLDGSICPQCDAGVLEFREFVVEDDYGEELQKQEPIERGELADLGFKGKGNPDDR